MPKIIWRSANNLVKAIRNRYVKEISVCRCICHAKLALFFSELRKTSVATVSLSYVYSY